ncbi:MAG: 50S ribosomal protein L3 [Candidatus Manganitrophaceae bacterium]|nr:MAG: 50S ribosomal protein L3 [Candidatus Manganitrophaceae bacterium]
MVDGLIGYKLGMTQVYSDEGKLVPVTVIEVGPCKVVQMKTVEREGYPAAQLSFDEVKEHRVTRPARGHFKRANVAPARVLREFRGDLSGISVGQVITAEIFQKGEFVTVTGTSKGKGFQGVVKRFHYAGGPATHGSMFHRRPGSIGASSFPSRVWKNKGMPGHMGSEKVTAEGLEVVEVRPEENLVFVKGSIPGSTKGLVLIHKAKRGKVKKQAEPAKKK